MTERPIARKGDLHVCPLCKVTTPIVTGSARSKTDGKPTAAVGDKTGCGATIVVGSSQSTTDDKPTAYLGSTTDHGGQITTGSPRGTVKV